ncbi:MAG: NADPH-dependent FMN reductase [Hyphomonadaceae bacterium]
MPRTVAVLVGSLRDGSFSRKTARAIEKLAPDLAFRFVEIGDLAFYNQDLETAAPPPAWTRFREAVHGADAVLFVTPEYNRGLPAVVKNALDVGSRPYGHSVFDGKPAAVVSVSPGAIAGFGANHQLRQSLVFLNMPVLQQPEAYVGAAHTLFDDAGALTNKDTEAFLAKFAQAFTAWIAKIAP